MTDTTGDATQRRRSALIVVGAIVLVVVAVVVALRLHDAAQDDPAPDRNAVAIELPASFGSYSRATGSVADTFRSRLEATSRNDPAASRHVDVYADRSGHLLSVALGSARDSVEFRHYLQDQSSDLAVDSVMTGYSAIGSVELSPAPYRGAFRCATGVLATSSAASKTVSVCAWADHDTSGVVTDLSQSTGGTPLPPSALADVTRRLRRVAEPT